MPKATVIKPQSYDIFIFKSTGSQIGNRYNSWSALMTAVTKQEGFKTILFEQDETIPAGAWNLDYVTLRGNSQEYNAGGYTLTFGDSTTISSWLTPSFHSLRLLSTSTTGHICTFTSAFSLICENTSNVQSSASHEFFASSATGQNLVALNNSARWSLIGGSTKALMRFTAAADTATIILSRGDGSVVTNNTFSTANQQLLVDIVGSANQALSSYPSTHSAATLSTTVQIFLTSAEALEFADKSVATGTTTGFKLGKATSQKIGFWNATPIIQPTTGVTGATRVGGGGTALTDTDTFDGYTLAKVVKALRNAGLLA